MSGHLSRRAFLLATAGGTIVGPAGLLRQSVLAGLPELPVAAVQAGPTPEPNLRWWPDPAVDGLKAFESIEDDPGHTEPGITHIFVEGDHYRFNMDTQQRDPLAGSTVADRQRNEVAGMVQNGVAQIINLGDTWRISYSMFIPSTLRPTSGFTSLMQMKRPGTGSTPLVMTSLRQGGPSGEQIFLQAPSAGSIVVAATDLAPLQGEWIDSQIDMTVGTKGTLGWVLSVGGTTVVSGQKTGINIWLPPRLWPKFGIYRRVAPGLMDTYLLIRNLRAYQFGGAPPSCSPTMAAPINLTGTGSGGQATWTWTPPSADCTGAPSGYAVYIYGTDSSTQMVTTTTPSATVSNLSPGAAYTAVVTAWDGGAWTAWSTWSNWTTVG